jgi:hypothetical protein
MRTIRHPRVGHAVFALCALAFVACGPAPQTTDGGVPGSIARLRVLHLSPNAPAIDAYLNGQTRVVSGVAFSAGSNPTEVTAGRSDFQVTASGSPATSAVATLSKVLLEADRDYTAFAFGKLAAIQVNAVEDTTQGLASNNVRVRVTHAADGVGPVNVYQVPATGAVAPVVENLRYGTSAPTVDLPPEAFVVGLDVNADKTPDLLFEIPALPKGTVVNVFAVLDEVGAPFLLAQLGGSTTVRINSKLAQLRVLHLSPNAPAVKAFVDGAVPSTFPELTFTRSTPFTSVSAGLHRLDVSADGTAAGAVLKVPSAQLQADKKYTAVAIGNLPSLSALLIENGPAGLAAGNIRIKAIHAAPGVGAVNVFSLPADGVAQPPLLSNVKFGDVSDALDLPAAAYTLGVDVNNDANPDLYFELPSLPAATVANVYVTADATGAVFALAQLDDATTVRIDRATSKLRVVHLSRNAPNVDVYANGTKVVTSLAYAATTMTLTVPSGAYDLAVTATGANISTAVIKTAGTRLLPGKAYSVVAYADLPNIAAAVLEDELTGINAATDIRLKIIHVAPTVTRGDVYSVKPAGNTLLVPNIGFGESKKTPDLASSSYKVGFDAESNGTIDIAFNLPVLAPGSFANVFVATDAANQVYLLVQTTGAGAIRVNPAL